MYKINIFKRWWKKKKKKRWWKNSPPPLLSHFSLVLLVSSLHPVTHLCNSQRDGLVWGPKVKDLEPVAWEGEGGSFGPKLSTPSAPLSSLHTWCFWSEAAFPTVFLERTCATYSPLLQYTRPFPYTNASHCTSSLGSNYYEPHFIAKHGTLGGCWFVPRATVHKWTVRT